MVDEETLRKARLRAVAERTSVDEVLRNFLESYAGASEDEKAALRDLIELSRQVKSGRSGRPWARDELYERD
jgi:hypothetical protein